MCYISIDTKFTLFGVMSHGTPIYVDAKLSNRTLNFVDAKNESYDTDFC
jgi:hypothetical protein